MSKRFHLIIYTCPCRQFAMRNQNYGGGLAGLGPHRSPPREAEALATSLAAHASLSSHTPILALIANPSNPLHSGLRGLGNTNHTTSFTSAGSTLHSLFPGSSTDSKFLPFSCPN